MASCAASRRPRRRLAWSSESAASPKTILSPLGVVWFTRALLETHPVMVFPSDSGSSSSEFFRGSRRMASTLVQSRPVSMMTSSCPRPASPSLAASALGEMRMDSSWTRVPRWAWAEAKAVENSRVTAKAAKKIARSRLQGKIFSAKELRPHWCAMVIGFSECYQDHSFGWLKSRPIEHGFSVDIVGTHSRLIKIRLTHLGLLVVDQVYPQLTLWAEFFRRFAARLRPMYGGVLLVSAARCCRR